MATLLEATESDLSFLGSDAYLKEFEKTKAAAVIVKKSVHLPPTEVRDKPALLIVDNADLAQAKVLELLAPPVPRPKPGIDPSARIAASAILSDDVSIAANVVIGERTTIGRGTILHAGVVLGGQTAVRDHTTIGDGAMVAARSAIAEDVPPKAIVSGMPALPHRQSLREQAALRRLPDLVVAVRKLEEEIAKLKGEK